MPVRSSCLRSSMALVGVSATQQDLMQIDSQDPTRVVLGQPSARLGSDIRAPLGPLVFRERLRSASTGAYALIERKDTLVVGERGAASKEGGLASRERGTNGSPAAARSPAHTRLSFSGEGRS